jgi:hypothetical protein
MTPDVPDRQDLAVRLMLAIVGLVASVMLWVRWIR